MARKIEEKMLVIRMSALGDVAMTIPVVYSLARQYAEIDVWFLTRPFFAGLLIDPPSNLRAIAADTKKEYHGFGGLVKLSRMLGKQKFDCVADLHDVLRSRYIDTYMRLHGKRVRMVKKQRRGRMKLLSSHKPQQAYIDRYCDVFSRLGYPVELTFRSIFDPDKPTRANLLAEVGAKVHLPDREPMVGIAPFARYETKILSAENTRRLIEMLAAEGIKVYLYGSRGAEQQQLEQWASEIAGVTSMAGKFTLPQELAAMSRMDVMVTMDSANQHLASLVGTPVVSVWGGTVPYGGFLGYGQQMTDAVYLNLPCQPCSVAGGETCRLGTFRCVRELPLQAIVARVKEHLVRAKQSNE